MKKVLGFVLVMLCAVSTTAYAGPAEGTYFSSGNTNTTPDPAAYGQVVRPIDSFAKAGEDVLRDVQKVESRWSNLPTGASTAMFSSDTAIKNASGLVHAITCYSDATATAGTIALLDNTAAGAGNVLWSFDVLAVAYNTPFKVELDVPFSIGLYADFTTTADMKCMVQFR